MVVDVDAVVDAVVDVVVNVDVVVDVYVVVDAEDIEVDTVVENKVLRLSEHSV